MEAKDLFRVTHQGIEQFLIQLYSLAGFPVRNPTIFPFRSLHLTILMTGTPMVGKKSQRPPLWILKILCYFPSAYLQFPAKLWCSNPAFLPLDLHQAMDPSGRSMLHHLGRALMHLSHLVGPLPFFETSSDWEDGAASALTTTLH